MDVALADLPAQPPLEECPVLRALGAFDRPLLSQGAEGVRCRSAATVLPPCGAPDALPRHSTARVPGYLPPARRGGQAAVQQEVQAPRPGRSAHQTAPARGALVACLATRLFLIPPTDLSRCTTCALLPRQEARALLKARRLGVTTPVVYNVDTTASCLYLEFVGGPSVKQHLRETSLAAAGARPLGAVGLVLVPSHTPLLYDPDLAALAHKIGRAVATLHDGGLVHGDLTTSNMIIREGDQQLVRCWNWRNAAFPESSHTLCAPARCSSTLG